jgi:prolipoprotein diacylglyceryltransferase
MSESSLLPVVLIAAALGNGLIAGASLDRSVVQLPARRKIGVAAYSAYSVAHELEGVGLIWYPVLGIGSALLTIAAAVLVAATRITLLNGSPIYLAAITAVMHTVVTARAAPLNFRQRSAQGDEAELTRIIDSFERWHAARAILQLASFAGTVVALASLGRVWS